MNILYFLMIAQLIHAQTLIIQLTENTIGLKFLKKYDTILKLCSYEYLEISNNKFIIGKFDTNFLKSIYFDTEVKSISKDNQINICQLKKKNNLSYESNNNYIMKPILEQSSLLNTKPNDTSPLVQHFAPRHLVRLTQDHAIKKKQEMNFKYPLSSPNKKKNHNIYLLDTGVATTHPGFYHKKIINKTIMKYNFTHNLNNEDINGHGTSIASIILSQLLGVCKNDCNIISYKIIDDNGVGYLSNFIKTLKYIQDNETNGILLLPFISEKSQIINDLMYTFNQQLNYTIVVPAGNYQLDSCNYSPSSSNDVITVGSIDSTLDKIADFSNYGKCINIFADGVNMLTLSNNINDNIPFDIFSGTSLSAGIVAGVLSQWLNNYDEINFDNNNDLIMKLDNLAIKGIIQPNKYLENSKTVNKLIQMI
ncbi:hypothetical protein DAPK24_021810 [Pichia kluyveri]|uniref:Peptidase S8/S53 domain-containing protein n=1 Tax=Pichia kluyveri TaxID=36015 RepID=A0AAV5R2V5_PICKL|nr:hypothetical protein DAPK24_021810 [Pichia kluyveri]